MTSRNKKLQGIALGLSVGMVGGLAFAPAAQAQAAPFADTPTNHWAYEAVQNLAKKGIVIGYPDGTFGGKRPMTRYEFAVAIDRMLRTLDDMTKANTTTPPPVDVPTPARAGLTQDDLNQIQALIDRFRPELTTIQSDLKTAQDDIDALRTDVQDAKNLATKAQDTANNSYGFGPTRKFQITGLLQARYQAVSAGQGSQLRFPQGREAGAGAGQYNGTYAQNGNKDTFALRRSRLKFTGAVTPNTKYGIQVDAAAAGTGNGVTIREGYISYTPGDGGARYPTFTAGQFANPFGYEVPLTSALILAPERPLAFNEGSNGLFAFQDYDRGVQIAYGFNGPARPQNANYQPLKATFALINGSGLNQNDSDQLKDSVYRLAYQSEDKSFGIGASYYYGHVNNPATTLAGPTGTGTTSIGPGYTYRQKELYGIDAQYTSPAGPFLLAEYVGGKFEQRSYFNSPTTGSTLTPSVQVTNYANGNRVEGYYVQGGYTFTPAGSHPLTLAAGYDVFRRAAGGPGSNSSYDDKNLGYGAMYNLDKQTRLRFWYERPDAVAHAPNVTLANGTVQSFNPPHYGLFTTDLQVRF